MTVMFLVLLAVPLAFAAGWVAGREHAQQKRDATVTAAVSPKAPEVRLVLIGGPFDGGRVAVSPQIWRRVPRCPVVSDAGRYEAVSQVWFTDGGAVVECEWRAQARQREAT